MRELPLQNSQQFCSVAFMEITTPPNRLVELRKAAGLSQEALAREVGVAHSTAWRWEHGQMKVSQASMRKLCALFGCSVEHLLGWDRPDIAA